MRIGIDARLINETGVGRYIRNLIGELAIQDKTNEYVVFLRANTYGVFTPPNVRWTKVRTDIPWHSIAEQLIMPWVFLKARLDLVHIPYFNIPILYPGKMVATIHDLTILHYPTGKATTLPLPSYWVKLLGYRAILEIGLHRVSRVIAVSFATAEELMDHVALDERKISVIHEGVREGKSSKRLIKDPYFLYVGNAYPHKNLEILFEAIGAQTLVLVGKEDLFYKRLPRSNNATFFGQANDEQLGSLYTYARALVFPSRMEGFGLPALEAAVYGTPVICSDIPAFREILGPLGNYFSTNDVSALRTLIAHPEKLKKPTKEEQQELLKRFSWRQMAAQTLRIYEQV